MGHLSRLATRKSATPAEWLKVCSQIGEQANLWADRNDLAVYGGEDAGMGQALACFIHSTAEIEISLPIAFGKATTPEMVGDLRERRNQYEFPEAVGVILHEAFHARYSGWNYSHLETLDKEISDAFMLLEESRIEGKAVQHYPENALFMRASSMNLSFANADESLSEMTATAQFANLAGLTLARVTAGVLDEFDVASVRAKLAVGLTQPVLDKLEKIWTEFQSLATHQIIRGVELATEWVKVIKEQAKANGEPETPEGGQGTPMPQALADLLSDLMDAIGEAIEQTSDSTSQALIEQQSDEELKEEISERKSEAKRQQESEKQAEKTFSPNSSAGESGSSSRLINTRKPEGVERAGAVLLSQMLEKAKYVERSVTEINSVIPQGRLRPRALVQKKALESKGVRSEVATWTSKKRKHTDDPTLKIGVMVDISGSMGSAMDAMASIAWILSEAGRRVQAKTAMVYYGSGVFPTLKVGQHLPEVNVYSAPDGTEKFGEAYKALDGTLGLTFTDGVRLLVIVSDGHYTSTESDNAKKAIAECERNGVGVLWVTPKECSGGGAESLIGKSLSAQQVTTTDTQSIAREIGKSIVKSLEKIGGRV
jgi:hypothetical protein